MVLDASLSVLGKHIPQGRVLVCKLGDGYTTTMDARLTVIKVRG